MNPRKSPSGTPQPNQTPVTPQLHISSHTNLLLQRCLVGCRIGFVKVELHPQLPILVQPVYPCTRLFFYPSMCAYITNSSAMASITHMSSFSRVRFWSLAALHTRTGAERRLIHCRVPLLYPLKVIVPNTRRPTLTYSKARLCGCLSDHRAYKQVSE